MATVILVDPLRWHPARRPGPHRSREQWAHLAATDGPEELHAFAAALGLRREWFQADHRLPHYDLRPRTWRLARARGAVLVPTRELIRRIRSGEEVR